MLHAPVNKAKGPDPAARTAEPPERERELHPRLGGTEWARGGGSQPGRLTAVTPRGVAALQGSLGNQSVLRMLPHRSAAKTQGALPLQTKLVVNQPGDEYEQEAERVSGAVMRTPQPLPAGHGDVSARRTQALQRKCSCGGTCDTCRSSSAEGREDLQRKALTGTPGPTVAPRAVHDALHSPGRPLDSSTRSFMESRFGENFSHVRVHTGPTAEASTRAVNAHAYTVGQDLVFGEGKYRPETAEGKGLIAHELVHTLQQRGSGLTLQRDPVKERHEPDQYSSSAFLGSKWKDVNELGLAYQEKGDEKHPGGATIRDAPSGKELAHLDQNAKVFILREGTVGGDRWYAAVSKDTGVFGYIQREFIWRNLPDPGSVVVKIHSGESPLEIAAKHYTGKGFDQWGKDKRYVVNALVYVNQLAKHNTKDSPGLEKQEGVDAPWVESIARADRYIWLPSAEYLNAIYEDVKAHGGGSGSVTYDLVDFVKNLGHKLLYGAAFLGGIVHGIFQSLWDTVAGLATAVYDILKSLFTLHIVSDIEELSGKVASLSWDDIKSSVGAWASDWADKLNSPSAWTAGHAHGYLTGYVMAEAFMLLIGVGEIEAAKTALWGSKLGKAIEGTSAFRKLAEAAGKIGSLGDKAVELAGKVGKIIEKTPLVGKTAAVAGKVIQWTLKGVEAILHLPQKWARAVARQILRAPGLERLLPRIDELSERAQKWLFGCFNPCKWEPGAVQKTLEDLDKGAIEAEAEAAEQRAASSVKSDRGPGETPGSGKTVKDPDAGAQGGQASDAATTGKPATPTTFASAKEDLIEELRKENQRLSSLARTDEPAAKAARANVERLKKETSRLSTEVATEEKKYNRATLARNPKLENEVDRVRKLRAELKAHQEGLAAAEKDLEELSSKQNARYEQMRKNRKEIDDLAQPERKLDPKERGRVNEVRALKEEGLKKNTVAFNAQDPNTREWATTIPDAMLENGATVDVKDYVELSETQQLRLQRVISNRRGQKPVIITGMHTKVPAEMERNYVIIRKTYLGPQRY